MKVETALKRIEYRLFNASNSENDLIDIVFDEIKAIRNDIKIESIKAGKLINLTIKTPAGDKEIEATSYGLFAVHKGKYEGYRVTHIPTGLSLEVFGNKTKCIRCCKELSKAEAHKIPNVDSDEGEKVSEALKSNKEAWSIIERYQTMP